MKGVNFLAGLLPYGSGIIANNGFSTEDREAIEEAYHDDVGVRVTIEMAVTSYGDDVTYEPLN
ncbi:MULTISPECIES: hypothetical protein [Pontibacillus]|uniref:Uncharacterized protein n=1 Tax=Pontibacillus chungwhensis TaxID=265426 RepID=A0ABY8V0F2_9BACI|nr:MULTISPECIES: hypothetical protein [Pontibacillus]MCD5324597.1 hypothetical protein [Pontibacillus sp. HN14]WIF99108.1 hypothetical protein QNI29_05485 [Pontibacillus chungwhensis]